jgi:hypothetical protein
MKLPLFGFLMLLTLAWAAPAWAGDTLTLAVVDFVAGTVMPLVAAVVAAFAVIALRKLADKFGMESLLAQEDRLQDLARQGVALAEELAARRLKEKELKLPGGEKLNIAVAHILSLAPEISRAQAENLVEAMLGMTFGAGASGKQAV